MGPYPTEEVAGKRPLTTEIMGNTGEHLDLARQINQRLYELRDRLFGATPTGLRSSQTDAKNGPASGFTEAYGSTARDLYNTLASIDGLSSEIANRL